jgi:hypothetical protein
VKVVQVLAMDQKHKHVETLAANLKTDFNPVHLSELEEFGACECFEQASLLLCNRLLLV